MGRTVLGLSDEEFYSLTPRQYHLLLAQHEREVNFNEFLFGQLTSTVANFSQRAPKEWLKPTDYMPSHWDDKPTTKRKRKPSGKAMAAKVRALFGPVAVQAK